MAIVATATVARAQPSGFSLVSGDPLTAFRVSSSRATAGVVDVAGPGFSRAVRIDVHEPGENWDVELGARLGRAVTRGEVAVLRFHARAIRGAGETGEVYFTAYAQKASPGWDKSMQESLAVGPDWQAFTLPFAWGAAYAASQASFVFGVGGVSQAIEIGGIEAIGFGPGVTLDMLPPAQFTYAGRAADDPWRAEAAARIEAVRKGDLVIEVVDDGREGLEDVEVRVEQRRHAFPFGSALVASRLTAGRRLMDSRTTTRPTATSSSGCSTPAASRTIPSGRRGQASGAPRSTRRRPWRRSTGCAIAACGRAATCSCGPAGATCRRACSSSAARRTPRR